MTSVTPMDATGQKQCTATSKQSQQRCKRRPSIGRTTCKMHGGTQAQGVASHRYKHGKYSKHLYLPKNVSARVEELLGDVIQNLEDSIHIQKALETELLERLHSGDSPSNWQAMLAILDDEDDEMSDRQRLTQIRTFVENSLDQYSLIVKIQSIQDSQRKLTETLTKCRKEQQETYTQEQWSVMLNVILNAARVAITDRATLARFIRELDVHTGANHEQYKSIGPRSEQLQRQ